MAPNPNQATMVAEVVAGPAPAGATRAQITLVDAAGGAAVATTNATVIADLAPAATLADVIAKVNAILAALRAAGITKAS